MVRVCSLLQALCTLPLVLRVPSPPSSRAHFPPNIHQQPIDTQPAHAKTEAPIPRARAAHTSKLQRLLGEDPAAPPRPPLRIRGAAPHPPAPPAPAPRLDGFKQVARPDGRRREDPAGIWMPPPAVEGAYWSFGRRRGTADIFV